MPVCLSYEWSTVAYPCVDAYGRAPVEVPFNSLPVQFQAGAIVRGGTTESQSAQLRITTTVGHHIYLGGEGELGTINSADGVVGISGRVDEAFQLGVELAEGIHDDSTALLEARAHAVVWLGAKVYIDFVGGHALLDDGDMFGVGLGISTHDFGI